MKKEESRAELYEKEMGGMRDTAWGGREKERQSV